MGTNPDFTLLSVNLSDVAQPESIPPGLYGVELYSVKGHKSQKGTHGIVIEYQLTEVKEFSDPKAAAKAFPDQVILLGKTIIEYIYSTKATPDAPAGNPWRIKKFLKEVCGCDVDAEGLTIGAAFENVIGTPLILTLEDEIDPATNEPRPFPAIVNKIAG